MSGYILPPNGPNTVIEVDDRNWETSWQHHLNRGSAGGVDLVAAVGTPVYAPADGVVTLQRWNGTGGHTITLAQAGGWKDQFMHMREPNPMAVTNGSTVKQGQLIGWSGNTANGKVGGVVQHLHWHRIDPSGSPRRNPHAYFGTSGGGSGDYGFGLNGTAQKECQRALTTLKLYSGAIDGEFGVLSVKAFQQYLKNVSLLPANYDVDGEPGPKYGLALQTLAKKYGYTGDMDGAPGDLTSAALIKWAAEINTPTTPVPVQPKPEPVEEKVTWTFGIDISTAQKGINLAQAKDEGVQFVIVKAGGNNVLPMYVAPEYKSQIDTAKAFDLPVGHYFVTGKGDSVSQANYFVDNLYRFDKSTDILVLDNELFTTGNGNSEFWDDAKSAAFLAQVIKRTGIDPRRVYLYGYASVLRAQGSWVKTVNLGVRLWWASYGDSPFTTGKKPTHQPDLQGSFPAWHIHQFSSNVFVAGLHLDGNFSNLTVDEIFFLPQPAPLPSTGPEDSGPSVPSEPKPEPQPAPGPDPEPVTEPVPVTEPTPVVVPVPAPSSGSNLAWIVPALGAIVTALTAIIAALQGM